MKTVWKFELEIMDEVTIRMPKGAKVLAVGSQRPERVALWAELDPLEGLTKRKFYVVGTGGPVPEKAAYIGTVLSPPFVWHIYEAG